MAENTQSLKGTRTAQYLATAYVAESTAVTRYTYYAQQAQKENYFQYAGIFNETAANELHHGKIFLKYLVDGGVTGSTVGVDSGNLTDSVNNLRIAAGEEQREGVEFYTEAADVARSEGFDEIADRFLAIASVEAHHEARFRKMIERIENGTVWKRDKHLMVEPENI